jgi:hypothetical protein
MRLLLLGSPMWTISLIRHVCDIPPLRAHSAPEAISRSEWQTSRAEVDTGGDALCEVGKSQNFGASCRANLGLQGCAIDKTWLPSLVGQWWAVMDAWWHVLVRRLEHARHRR